MEICSNDETTNEEVRRRTGQEMLDPNRMSLMV